MREPYSTEERETLHVYIVRENTPDPPIIDAEPEPTGQQTPRKPFGLAYCAGLGVFFTLLPLVALLVANLLPSYDAILSKTLTLHLSLHPMRDEIPLDQLPVVTGTNTGRVKATGLLQEPATRAEGLITFYNGLFTSQTVPAGTLLTGKDGGSVVTSVQALIPAAAPTTPPTYGTISVVAHSSLTGAAGNIVASDIDRECCGASILAQNVDAFRGGTDAQDVTVVTQSNLTNATATLKTKLDQQTHDQAQREVPAGQQLLPLQCATSTTANHQAGDQALEIAVTVSAHCLPLAYALASVQQQAMTVLSRLLPHAYRVVRISLILGDVTAMDARQGTATLAVFLTAYVQSIHPSRRR